MSDKRLMVLVASKLNYCWLMGNRTLIRLMFQTCLQSTVGYIDYQIRAESPRNARPEIRTAATAAAMSTRIDPD